MALPPTTSCVGFAEFFESGELSDFTIECGPYEFKAHKLVLCASSHYFRIMCTRPFKEASENAVKFEDQQPLMVARMLQYLYYGKYDVTNVTADLTRILDKAASKVILNGASPTQDLNFEVHAAVYAMAVRFDIPALKATSASNFICEMRSEKFNIADLVSAINTVYTTTPDNDLSLRKWVVYRAQQIKHVLVRYDDFRTVLQNHPDFAWDFAMKYARANFVFCSHCNNTIDLVQCKCGFYGMCGSPTCTAQTITALVCTGCSMPGTLQREVPPLEKNIMLGELGRTDEPDAEASFNKQEKTVIS